MREHSHAHGNLERRHAWKQGKQCREVCRSRKVRVADDEALRGSEARQRETCRRTRGEYGARTDPQRLRSEDARGC
jgi:hypothetical protein